MDIRWSFPIFMFYVHISQAIFIRSMYENWLKTPICEGSCQLSMTCWMNNGHTVPGRCRGYIYSCCEFNATRSGLSTSYAQPRKLTQSWDDFLTNTIDIVHDITYGPVRNEPICGLQRISRRRIVGGHAAGFGLYPWQALVMNGKSRCGGALIDKQHVVTAGHCVSNYTDPNMKPFGIVAYLGEYSLFAESEPLPFQKRVVTKVYLHPYYEFTPQADRYDVAVLKLQKPVKYAPHILPLCLPQKNEHFAADTEAMVSGWGARDPESEKRPRNLQAVDVKVVESRKCEDWHHENGIQLNLSDDMMCAGHIQGGKDACQGDSGGPLMTQRFDGRWVLIGIVSSGYSCAKAKQPGIYHRVSKSADWISYVTRISFKKK